MTALPWTLEDLATKADIADLRHEIVALELRLEAKIDRSWRSQVLAMILANASMLGGAATLAQLG